MKWFGDRFLEQLISSPQANLLHDQNTTTDMKVLCGTYRWGWRGPTGGAGGDLPGGPEGTYRGGRRGPTGGAGGDLPVGLEGTYRWGWRGPTGGTGGTYR